MSTQTVYNENMAAGFAGQIANQIPNTLISRNAEGVINFGAAVAQGSADLGCVTVSTGNTDIIGIATIDRSVATTSNGTTDQYPVGNSVLVMTKGAVYVTASVAVSAGDPVHVVAATGAFTNTGAVAIAGARYDTSAAIGGLALVRLA